MPPRSTRTTLSARQAAPAFLVGLFDLLAPLSLVDAGRGAGNHLVLGEHGLRGARSGRRDAHRAADSGGGRHHREIRRAKPSSAGRRDGVRFARTSAEENAPEAFILVSLSPCRLGHRPRITDSLPHPIPTCPIPTPSFSSLSSPAGHSLLRTRPGRRLKPYDATISNSTSTPAPAASSASRTRRPAKSSPRRRHPPVP